MKTPKTEQIAASAGRPSEWLSGAAIAVCLAHLLSALAPNIWTWGVNYWSLLPIWVSSILLIVVIVSAMPGTSQRIANLFERRTWPRSLAWIAIALAFALFMVFRSRGYSYGDGYSMRNYIAVGNLPSISGNLALLAGDLVTHWVIHRTVVMPLGGSVALTYGIVSALAGVVSLIAVARIARSVYPKDRGGRWAIVAAAFSSGMAALWFGHVEAYSLVGASLLWCIAFLLSGRDAWAWGMWLVACAFHLLAVAFLPVLLWMSFGQRWIGALSPKRIGLLLLVGFILWGVGGAVFSLVKPGIFVPLLPGAETSYSVFSVAHLSDTLNLLLFASPLGLAGLIAWIVRRGSSATGSGEKLVAILAVSTVSLWYFSFWVDPLIGAFRDWDLIGVYGIPFSILGVVLLLGHSRSANVARSQWVVIAAFAIAHTGAFVMTVQNESKVIDRVNSLVREDVHYSQDFHDGERLMSWTYVLTHLTDNGQMAIEHLRNRSMWKPDDRDSWNNLGALYWHLEEYDSAAVSLEKSIQLKSNDPLILEELSLVYAKLEKWDKAGAAVERLSAVRELKVSELNVLAYAALMANADARSDSLLRLSLQRQPGQQVAHYYLGLTRERRADTVGALVEFEQAMSSPSSVEDVYSRTMRLYQARQQWADAERVATAWQKQFPGSALASFSLGVCRVVNKQYAGAVEALQSSITISPTNALAHFYLATAYRNLGEREKAMVAARRAAELDSQLALPYLEMVYLAADAGDRGAAVAATREYLRRAPGDSGMTYLRQFMEP